MIAAVESFTLENDGVYPQDLSTAFNNVSKSTMDYMPEGMLVINPYTMARTEPVWGAATNIGETGYRPVDADGDGAADGCVVDGMSDDYRTIIFCARVNAGAIESCW